jgi:hypothetical protein
MSKLGIVICLLLGPLGWLYLVYKLFLQKHIPPERPPEWLVPKGVHKGYKRVKW